MREKSAESETREGETMQTKPCCHASSVRVFHQGYVYFYPVCVWCIYSTGVCAEERAYRLRLPPAIVNGRV